MLSWTVINNVPRGITNSTGVVRAELITMSLFMAEIALILKTSRGGVTRCR